MNSCIILKHADKNTLIKNYFHLWTTMYGNCLNRVSYQKILRRAESPVESEIYMNFGITLNHSDESWQNPLNLLSLLYFDVWNFINCIRWILSDTCSEIFASILLIKSCKITKTATITTTWRQQEIPFGIIVKNARDFPHILVEIQGYIERREDSIFKSFLFAVQTTALSFSFSLDFGWKLQRVGKVRRRCSLIGKLARNFDARINVGRSWPRLHTERNFFGERDEREKETYTVMLKTDLKIISLERYCCCREDTAISWNNCYTMQLQNHEMAIYIKQYNEWCNCSIADNVFYINKLWVTCNSWYFINYLFK